MKKRYSIFLICFGFILSLSSALPVEGQKYLVEKKENLKGIKGFYIYFQPVSPETKNLGVNQDKLKKDVESKLTKAGISIIQSEKEFLADKDTAQLHVLISKPLEYQNVVGDYVHTLLSITVMQRADTVTASQPSELKDIWHQSKTSSSSKKDAGAKTKTSLQTLLDYFISDYREVNPE